MKKHPAELSRRHPHPTLPHRGRGDSLEWRGFAEFSADELYEVLRFRQAIFVVEQASPYPDLDGLDRRAHHLLLRRDGALAGYLRLVPHPDEQRVAIGRVAVAAPSRRQGLARRMMAEALARIRRDFPACAVTLSAQAHLVPFYESLGFRPTAPPYDDHGVPHVEMALDAPPSTKSLIELLNALEPIEEEFPEIEDPPPEDVDL